MIAEQYGVLDAAETMYRRVEKPKDDSPGSSYSIAQQRLAKTEHGHTWSPQAHIANKQFAIGKPPTFWRAETVSIVSLQRCSHKTFPAPGV